LRNTRSLFNHLEETIVNQCRNRSAHQKNQDIGKGVDPVFLQPDEEQQNYKGNYITQRDDPEQPASKSGRAGDHCNQHCKLQHIVEKTKEFHRGMMK
jgi:hypothetical protein